MKPKLLHPALINLANQIDDAYAQRKKELAEDEDLTVLMWREWMHAKGMLRPKQVTLKKRFSLYGLLALLAVWGFVAWFVVELVEGYQ